MRAQKMPFDTHDFVKKAKLVGFTEQQAEFQAQELSHILWDGIDSKIDKLVTKSEFDQETQLIRKDIDNIHKDIDNIRKDMVTKTEFNHEVQLLRKDMNVLEIKINAVDSKLTWLVSLFGLASIMLSVLSLLRGFHVI